jgi:hypothetical protein
VQHGNALARTIATFFPSYWSFLTSLALTTTIGSEIYKREG